MNIQKVNSNIKYLYHYTAKENVSKIMQDKAIISKDQYVFFTESLKDSITAFEREMMVEGKLYIDVDGNLQERKRCNKNDYCILKIPYQDDNQFYKFTFENQKSESIYSISITHKGAYHFKNAKVIEFPQNKMVKNITKIAAAAIISGAVLFPYNNTSAASWLDANNYDISWYSDDPSIKDYVVDTPQKVAGFAYLVNEKGVTFVHRHVEIKGTIDLSTNKWETIKSIFSGDICGAHRIILSCLDSKFCESRDVVNVEYSYNIYLDNESKPKKVSVAKPYTVKKLKEATGKRNVFLNNQKLSDDTSLRTLNIKETDVINVFDGMHIFVEDKVSNTKTLLAIESGDAIMNVKEMYSKKTNIPKEKIVLVYNNKILDDGRTLADYNIQKESILNTYTNVQVNMIAKNGEEIIENKSISSTSGEKVKIKFDLKEKYEIEKILVDGADKTNEVINNELEVTCGNKDINISATYKLKKQQDEGGNKNQEEDKKQNEDDGKQQENNNGQKDETPKTGVNNIISYIISAVVSVIGIIGIKTKFNKKD